MTSIDVVKFPKPKSKRFCKGCDKIVNATRFVLMASNYQAWGWCKCGAHSFEEYLNIRWWINE
jgi:hypothetical protein